jgi:hypothetical protein
MRGRSARAACAVLAATATMACQLGIVAAAGPNQLSNAWVSPTSGTTATVFTFSVDYRSDKDFAASGVVAAVAGRSVTLTLASGGTASGTFRGTATLPAGRWAVSFQAQASQGPNPTLGGPTVVVTAPAPTPPPATPKPAPPPAAPNPTPPPPHATPQPASAAPVTTAPVPRASSPASTPRSIPSLAATPAPSRSASPTQATAAATPSGGQGASSHVTPSPTSAVVGRTGSGTDAGERPEQGEDSSIGVLIGLGILSVAALTGALGIARRRGDPEGIPQGSDEPVWSVPAVHPITRPDIPHVEDPILLAMGLGSSSQPDPNAPITRSVRFGPGERPTPPTQRAH